MKIKIETKDMSNLANSIAHDVQCFLCDREIEDDEAWRIGQAIGRAAESAIWSELGL